MTQMIPDPTDDTIWFIGSAAEATLGAQVGDATLFDVHSRELCERRHCVVHDPSEHHMRGWRMNWRDDRGLMERICPHSIGHPDPDDLAYHRSVGRDGMGVHGCDGCCAVIRAAEPTYPSTNEREIDMEQCPGLTEAQVDQFVTAPCGQRDTHDQHAACVISECRDPADPREVVEMSSPDRPYKALRRACPRHLEMLRNIGLPVLRAPENRPEPDAG